MTEWTVHLEFAEGTSSKFWRARVEGKTLYVNYGKIGSNGQTQVKDLGDPAAAKAEYEKLVRDKRKKGYEDAASGGEGEGADADDDADADDADDAGDDDEPAPPTKKAAPKPAASKPAAGKPAASAASAPGHRLVLEAGNRTVEATLYLDGSTVRMDSRETYASPEAATRAFERLNRMLGGEGYKPG
jgi:predicted DNA-binding WGR domain protein